MNLVFEHEPNGEEYYTDWECWIDGIKLRLTRVNETGKFYLVQTCPNTEHEYGKCNCKAESGTSQTFD